MSNCPHCGAETTGGAFCGSCGKAIDVSNAGPRIVRGKAIAATGAGANLQMEELQKKANSASGALLAVAILALIGAGLLLLLFNMQANKPGVEIDWSVATPLLAGQVVLSAIFFGLWRWAKSAPLPAAIVGLVIYGSLITLDAVLDPTSIARGLIVKIIIVVVLIKAISAGVQHRQILTSQRETNN